MAADTKIIITAQTNQAEGALRSLGSSVDGISRKMFDFSGVAGTLTGALSITAFAGWIKGAIDAADQLYKLSQKTGTAVEELAGLKFAADQNGASLEVVANAAKKLGVQMFDKPELFKSLGISAKNTTGALLQVADILAAMPDGVEKTALSIKLMGKNGEEMIPFMNQGSDALQKLIDQGKIYNPVTAESALAAQQFNDSLSALKAQAGGLGVTIANDVLPQLTQIATAMATAAREGGLLTAVMVGVGGAVVASFTDDMLSREQKITKDMKALREEQKYALQERSNSFNFSPVRLFQGDTAINERNATMQALQNELEGIHKIRDANKAKQEDIKNFREEMAAMHVTPAQSHVYEMARFGGASDAEIKIAQDRVYKIKKLIDAYTPDNPKLKTGRTAAVKDPDAEARRFIASLHKETDQMGMGTEAIKLLEAAKLAAAHPKFAEAIFKEANAYHDKTALLYEATEATKKLAVAETQRLSALDEAHRLIVSIDPQAKANADWEKLLELQKKAVDENGNQVLSLEQIGLAYADMQGKGKEAMDQMSVFAEQAGRNIQNAFADFLFDPFKGGVSGMLQSFKTMLQRMAAEAAAAQILGSIGKWGKSNSGDGGVVGAIASIAGMMFPAKAIGGPVSFGKTYLVGERGPELFTPGVNGNITPNNQLGGSGMNITVHVNGNNQNPEAVRRAAGQGAREALAAFSQAGRYA